MWGSTILEPNYNGKYQFSFLNNNSDIIISLMHWQYWWWFWFSFLIGLYYVLVFKHIFSDSMKFNPKIVTSFRSHGKWGDVLVCFLPISWCLNILSNSTTLLKLIEWQSEAAVFTLRVRGKQWFWIYKIDAFAITKLYLNNNYFFKIGQSSIINKENKVHNIFYKNTKSKFSFDYFTEFKLKKENNINLPEESFKKLKKIVKTNLKVKKNNTVYSKSLKKNYDLTGAISNYLKLHTNLYNKKKFDLIPIFGLKKNNTVGDYINFDRKNKKFFQIKRTLYNDIYRKSIFNVRNESREIFSNRDYRIIYKIILDKKKNSLNSNTNGGLKFRRTNVNIRKYNPKRHLILTQKNLDNWVKENDDNFNNVFNYKNVNKLQHYLNYRLLRVNFPLTLPTNTFINVITNSFDVVHSWFIPGLGFKMDCVPGRSTHHSLYIDTMGMYFGQCAEICGRLHHHMPIRLCALNFEIWKTVNNHFFFKTDNLSNIKF